MAAIQELSTLSEGEFHSFEDFSACQQHAKLTGYTLSADKSIKCYSRYVKHIDCKHSGKICLEDSENNIFEKCLGVLLKQVRIFLEEVLMRIN